MKKVLGVLLAISLGFVIIVEFIILVTFITGRSLTKNVLDETKDVVGDMFSDIITESNYGPDVPELIYDSGEGDVIKYYGYKYRIYGHLATTETVSNGFVSYASLESESHTMEMRIVSSGVDFLKSALDSYFSGYPSDLVTLLSVNTQDVNLKYYMQDTADGMIAEIYDDGSEKYYMFVPMNDIYAVITCDDIVYMTNDGETVIYGDPSDDPMTTHTYSMYEVTAIDNTRNMLTDGTYVPEDENLSTEVTGSSDTYTSEADNETRKAMLNYANYNWNVDGTSDDTHLTIDLTSTTAKASEWVLTTSSPYAFTDNALRLHTLKAIRSADTFTVNGKITNQIKADRPYVILIKFLNEDEELLGIRVIDKRNEKIPANDVADWSYVLNNDGNIDISEIYALQFEIY